MILSVYCESDNNYSFHLFPFLSRPDANGNHGDGLPFARNTLAHALYPGAAELSGDIHFNMERPFSTVNPPLSSTGEI